MKFVMKCVAVAVMGLSLNAMAVQKDITINANVDPSLDMTLSDAQPLPESVSMQYIPGNGLAAYTMQAKIWSNEYSDVKIKLVNDVMLYDRAGSTTTVPMTISYGGSALTTTDTTLAKTTLFPGGEASIAQGSVAQELKFTQKTPGVLAAGNYTGVVSIYLSQATTSGT